jgi:ribosomal protein S18 acetylase RimI-like enzyme
MPDAAPDLVFRRADAGDLDALMQIERGKGYDALVGRSERGQHAQRLADPAVAIWLACDAQTVRAFAILEGIGDPHGGLYLRRIAARTRGQGDGAALLRATLAFAFETCAAPRYWLDVLAQNVIARRAYAAAGLVEEGLMRSSYAMPDGTRADRIIMAILADEWRARQVAASQDFGR